MEKISLYVFSRPNSIQVQVYSGKWFHKLIDTIEIEIPGEKSYAITSAGTVLKEGFFNNQIPKQI